MNSGITRNYTEMVQRSMRSGLIAAAEDAQNGGVHQGNFTVQADLAYTHVRDARKATGSPGFEPVDPEPEPKPKPPPSLQPPDPGEPVDPTPDPDPVPPALPSISDEVSVIDRGMHIGAIPWTGWQGHPWVGGRNLTYHVLDHTRVKGEPAPMIRDADYVEEYLREHGYFADWRGGLMVDLEGGYRNDDAGVEFMLWAAELVATLCPLAMVGFYNPVMFTTGNNVVHWDDHRLNNCEACNLVMPRCYDWHANSGSPGDVSYETHQAAYDEHVTAVILGTRERSADWMAVLPCIHCKYTTPPSESEDRPEDGFIRTDEWKDNVSTVCDAVHEADGHSRVWWWGTTISDVQAMQYGQPLRDAQLVAGQMPE